MRVYHLALESDWRAARAAGAYTTSTLGHSLAEVGFVHAAREEQVAGVQRRFYASVRAPLVLLEIDTDRLTSPWREDPVGGETFPHVYGPVNAEAVVAARPWHRSGRPKTFLELWLGEMAVRIVAALAVMLLAFAGSVALGAVRGDTGRWVGALVGLAAGFGLAGWWLRRRS